MRIKSKLCHLSENKAVVKVTGWINDKNIGSALAEGSTVDIAEDRAISRLNKRVNNTDNNENNKIMSNDIKLKTKINFDAPKNENDEHAFENKEPSDWSSELASIDAEIKRLNWSREEEIKFLEINFGINNRNKITKYKDIINYLSILRKHHNTQSTLQNTIYIENMLKESDIILNELSWDNKKGRDYLQNEFNVSSRKELDINQLKSFVEKLKSIRNQSLIN